MVGGRAVDCEAFDVRRTITMSSRKKHLAAALSIFFVAVFVHLYKLGAIPFGINVDEIGMGYDAFCLGNYGVDRYFESFPVYLINYGGGQSALYAYLDILPIKIWGLNVVTIRIVSVVMYVAAIVAGTGAYLILNDDDRKKKALLYLFLTAIMPVYVMLFRIGMDCNLMLAVGTIFFYFLIKAGSTGKNGHFLAAGIAGGIVLYTYAIAHIVMPVFIVLYLIYMVRIKKITLENVLLLGIPMALLAFPLIMVQIVNVFDMDAFKLGIFTVTKLPNYRIVEISLKNISGMSVFTTLKSIFAYDFLRYNSIPEFGTIYYFSIPFALAGFVKSVVVSLNAFKKRIFCVECLYLCWFMIVFGIGCCTEANTNKMNSAFLAVTYFVVEGVFMLDRWTKSKTHVYVGRIVVGVYAACATMFFIYYFGGQYKADYGDMEFFSYSFKEPLDFVLNDSGLSEKVTYMGVKEVTYTYFLEATHMSPYEYQNAVESGKYRFNLPDNIENVDYEGNYIVPDYNKYMNDSLEKLGFDSRVFDNYRLYTYDISSYRQDDAHIEWNSGVDSAGRILQNSIQEIDGEKKFVLVGWSYNEKERVLWDEVYLKYGNDKFFAEKVERADLAEVLGDGSLTECGLLFIIPADKIPRGEKVSVICMDKADRVIGTVTLQTE